MSVLSLARLAAERHRTPSPDSDRRTELLTGEPPTVDQSKVEILVSCFPTELAIAYVAVVAAVAASVTADQPKLALRWALLAVFALITPLMIYLLWRSKLRSDPATSSQAPWLELTAGTFAFVVWAISLPESPLTAWRAYDPAYSAIAVILGALLLSLLTPFMQRPATQPQTVNK